jgi:DNA-directed RNA polymerase II subunit RPB1
MFDKSIYQRKTSGLVHTIYNDIGPDETRQLFDNTQKLICNWLVYSGFSVGVSDLVIDNNTRNDMKNIIKKMKNEVYDIMKQIHEGKFENKSIKSNNDFFEQEVNRILNGATNNVGQIALNEIDNDNRMINMIKSGSKGNVTNIAQMISSLGQQNVEGKRIAYGFDERTLPHYTKFDDGPEARGFIENSFIDGLSASEFVLHAIGGREGLIF